MRPSTTREQRFCNTHLTGVGQRNDTVGLACLELGDVRPHGRTLGLLRRLAVEFGELGALLRDLADQELPVHLDLGGRRALGRMEVRERIAAVREGNCDRAPPREQLGQ